jgi:hypothetical protein
VNNRWRKARGSGIEKQPGRNSEGGVGSKRIREGGSEFLRIHHIR